MSNGDQDHLRLLLDQRAQRADVPQGHYRFPSFSERSDSPSLYSHLSPAHHGYATPSPATPMARFPHSQQLEHHGRSSPPPLSPRDRIAADPNASGMDLSDDCASDRESRFIDMDEADYSDGGDTEEAGAETRMSLLGPKMRVHSRAPWETGEDDGAEESHPDDAADTLSIFGGKRRVMRGFGFGSSATTRSNAAPRPSGESSRSTAWSKKSFETTSSNALHALAQASMSSTSLAILPSASTSRLPTKLSMPRLTPTRSRTTSSSSEATSVAPPLPSPRSTLFSERSSGTYSPTLAIGPSPSPVRSEFSQSSNSRARSPSPFRLENSYVHPYANPDLHSSSNNRDTLITPFGSTSGARYQSGGYVTRTDSSATLMASQDPLITSTSTSAITTLSMSTSVSSVAPTPPSMHLFMESGRQLSSPKPPVPEKDKETEKQVKKLRRDTKLGPITISSPSNFVKGELLTPSSPYTLITLEQAQARAKERSRSITAGATPTPSSSTPLPSPSPIDNESGRNRTTGGRARARTNSTGTKVKNALGNFVGETRKAPERNFSEPLASLPGSSGAKLTSPSAELPPGRSLKQKRSGFMKLFRGELRDSAVPAPPVPPLQTSDYDWRIMALHDASSSGPPKLTSHRVPAPPVSPSMMSSTLPLADHSNHYGRSPPASPKRSVPTLSIQVTTPHIPHPRTASANDDHDAADNGNQDVMAGLYADTDGKLLSPQPRPPASAPPGTTKFATLSLRPVSTIFSSHFADHLVDERRREPPVLSPQTAGSDYSTTPSPTTPGFALPSPQSASSSRPAMSERSSSDSSGMGTKVPFEDQSAVIAGLQDQILSVRKTWQRQIWELEGQVRDLKAEVEELKVGEVCQTCGRGAARSPVGHSAKSVVDRPRARTGTGARFASGNC